MSRRASLALLATLSCQDPTQITVELHGQGFVCSADASAPAFRGSVVVGRPQVSGFATGARAEGAASDCHASGDALDLGTVVLVPSDGVAPVEVLAVAVLESADGASTQTVQGCLDLYASTLSGEAPASGGELCIFARRSLGFLNHTSLTLPITLSTACAGVICEPSLTCEPGRGCVSAVVDCRDDGSCPSEGGGGVGGAGAGGAGGSGGAGPSPWEPLEVPSSAIPHDVIGFLRTNAGAERLELFVAADNQVLRYDPSSPTPVVQMVGSLPRAAMAVSVQSDFIDEVAIIGEQGIARSTDSFTQFAFPVPIAAWQNNGLTGARFDLAWRIGEANPSWSADNGPNACWIPAFNISGSAPGGSCGASVAANTVSVARAGTSFSLFNGNISSIGVSNTGTRSASWVGAPPAGSDLGASVSGDGASLVIYPGLGEFVVNNSTGLQLTGLSGYATAAGTDLYGVGTRDGAPWIGSLHAVATPVNLTWVDLAPPPIAAPESIWVGDNETGTPLVVVVGPDGVARARLADLAP